MCIINQQHRMENVLRFTVFAKKDSKYYVKVGVPVFLAVESGANSLTVTLGNIHCIQRLTFPLVPPMLLVFCSRVTVSANGLSSPAVTESP